MLRCALPTLLVLAGSLSSQDDGRSPPVSPLTGSELPAGARTGDWVVGFGHVLH